MGAVYLDDHCYEDAEECFQKGVALNPTRAESHFHLARALDAQGRAAEAAAALEQAVALDPRAEGPLLRLAMVRRAQGELGIAAELLRRATVLKPEDADVFNSLGVVLREQGQTKDAISRGLRSSLADSTGSCRGASEPRLDSVASRPTGRRLEGNTNGEVDQNDRIRSTTCFRNRGGLAIR